MPTSRRSLPSVDRLLGEQSALALLERFPRDLVVGQIRAQLASYRVNPSELANFAIDPFFDDVQSELAQLLSIPSPRVVVNATGVVLHTNLGRAELAEPAIQAVAEIASSASTLEFDLATGNRGSRDASATEHLKALTGAEDALVVNNNAAAVLLALNSMAQGKEVIVSRGELVEIGGSFRIPDILAKSGAILREVGTTNRTHPSDYADAVGPDTGLLLKVHPSNYAIDGFTAEVLLSELVAIGREHGVPVVEDLGSGALIDLADYNLPSEPVVNERVRSGADAITFSGDKLLGGPQAGLIVGRTAALSGMKKNPLKRALRCDKMTLAALDATLRLYRTSTDLLSDLPTLRALTRDLAQIESVASCAAELIATLFGPDFDVDVGACESQIGSGAQPTAAIASRGVSIAHSAIAPLDIAAHFRANARPIIGRVHNQRFWLDCRCIEDAASLVPTAAPSSDPAPSAP